MKQKVERLAFTASVCIQCYSEQNYKKLFITYTRPVSCGEVDGKKFLLHKRYRRHLIYCGRSLGLSE